MKKILIADDDPMMVKLIEFNLRRAGLDVIICREGSTVVARAHAEQPDMIILDVMMPGRSGLELVADLKADPILASLPVLIVTGEGKSSTLDGLIAAGATNVYTKP